MTYRHIEQADDEAAAWVARMDSGRWDGGDEAALQAWLSGDYRRRGALLQAQSAWLLLDRLDAAVAIDESATRSCVAQPLLRDRRAFLATGAGGLAASVIVGLVALNTGATYSTQLGEIRKVPLADGSVATINSASEIEVRLADREREVRLYRGEAWFQVAKDRHRPFVVAAGPVRAQAIGTAFSVRRREGGADILVTEGVVEAWAAQAGGHRVRLTAGERAFVRDDAAISQTIPMPSEVDRDLAWRGGLIDLRGRSLADAVAEFNRYNRRKLVLSDPVLTREELDGIFRTDDPEGFATAVGRSFGAPVDTADPGLIRIGGSA